MDFNSILSLASQNSATANKVEKKFSTDLAPPKKEKKDKEKTVKSEAVRKLLEEKEKEKQAKLLKEKRRKEAELQRQKEEEKKNRFRIPKKEGNKSDEPNKGKSESEKVITDKSGSVKNETKSESREVNSQKHKHKDHHKHKHKSTYGGNMARSDKKGTKTARKDLVLKPNEVRITALSSHARETHMNHHYDFLLKNDVDMKSELQKEIKRREFEEKRAKLLEKMKQGPVEEKKPNKEGMTKEEKEEKRRKEREMKRLEQHRERELNGETVRKRRRGMTDAELKEWLAKGDSNNNAKTDKDSVRSQERTKGDKSSASSVQRDKSSSSQGHKVATKVNSGPKKPPPMGFGDLLKLAQAKSSEVIDYNPFCPTKPKKETTEPERLLTQAETDRQQDELRHKMESGPKSTSLSKNEVSKIRSKEEVRNKEISNRDFKRPESDSGKSKLKDALLNGSRHSSPSGASHSKSLSKSVSSSVISSKTSSSKAISQHSSTSALKQSVKPSSHGRESPQSSQSLKRAIESSSKVHSPSNPSGAKKLKLDRDTLKSKLSASSKNMKTSIAKGSSSQDKAKLGQQDSRKRDANPRHYDCENENVLVCGPSKPQEKKAAPESLNPWDRIYGQIKKNHPAPVKKKRIDDYSDEESDYDDEDGFIDDEASDVDENEMMETDYSSHIRQIFGYDKRKYRYESDHELKNMESSFREQMKEEARSARLGLMEDLEDMKREEEEMKRKQVAVKKRK